MALRFSRPLVLARRHFAAGDPVPLWLAEVGMRRFILAKYPGSIYDDTTAAPPEPAPSAPPPEHDEADRVKQEQLAASWAEWAAMRERLGFDEEPTPKEETDAT